MGKAASIPAGLNWLTVTTVVLFHIGALAAFFFFSWRRLAVMAVLYVLAINVGIGMCYHRLLTHRGYQTPKWLEYLMSICATISLEGGPIFWVSTHRVHHQLSDQEGDPHTPREGGWWAHAGWILFGEALHAQTEVLARYSPDLTAKTGSTSGSASITGSPSPSAAFCCSRAAGSGAAGSMASRWFSGALLLRVTLGLHATWLVNSATHMWGSRRFETRDDSRNSWWVALLTGGEGWHNNHHAHPVSARHGLKWYEIDPNFWGIWLLSKLGLAKKIHVAKYDPENPKPAGL